MTANYLHHHKDFKDLIQIIEDHEGIEAALIEKECLSG